jgi:serine/threonine-protein kinase
MTEAADVELTPGSDVGGYIVERKIGEGGMGIVYAAQQVRIGKRVAVKVLGSAFCRDPSAVQRFEQEARLVNEIRHGNIVDVFQHGELPDGRNYLVMELLEGESLSARIERGPIPWHETMFVLDAVCDALQAVHETSVVHRDLKSDNIFLVMSRGQIRVKLLDFGLAKLAGNNPRAVTKTKTGIVVGTPGYMAPEIARGKPADHRTDVYALGVLAFKMLTARLPFEGEPLQQLVQHLRSQTPSPSEHVPNLPPPLSELVMRMMAKEPENRPAVAEMRSLFAAMGEGRLPIVPATAVRRPARRPAMHFILLAAGVLAVGAIAFAVVSALS